MYLKLADAYISVTGLPDHWRALVPAKFKEYVVSVVSTDAPMHSLQFRMCDDDHLQPMSGTIDFTKVTRIRPVASGIHYQSVCSEGPMSIDSSVLSMRLNCHPLGTGWAGNIIENALRVMVAYIVFERGGFMLHSASIIDQDQAVLLVGHSGAGKSTCSQFAIDNGCHVISDDINVLMPADGNSWKVVQVPFNGSSDTPPVHPPMKNEVNLKAIYELNQSENTSSDPVSAAIAVARLYANLPFINLDSLRANRVMANLSGLLDQVPFRRLNVRRDSAFLDVLREAS